MADRPGVHARDILWALHELQRRGSARIMDRLDEEEPDLTDHLTESLGLIHREILGLGGPARASRRTYRRVEELMLVCMLALRRGRDGSAERDVDEVDDRT